MTKIKLNKPSGYVDIAISNVFISGTIGDWSQENSSVIAGGITLRDRLSLYVYEDTKLDRFDLGNSTIVYIQENKYLKVKRVARPLSSNIYKISLS